MALPLPAAAAPAIAPDSSYPFRRATLHSQRLTLRAAEATDAADLHECFADEEVMRYWSTLPHESLEKTEKWMDNMTESHATNGVTDFVMDIDGFSVEDSSPRDTIQKSHISVPPSSDSLHTRCPSSPSSPRRRRKVIGKIGIYSPPVPISPSTQPADDASTRQSRSTQETKTTGEIGLMINRAYQRQGYASEAMAVVLPYLFSSDVPRIDVITADVDPRNLASCNSLQKVGFKETSREQNTWQVGGVWVDSVYFALEKEEWLKTRV